MGARHADGGLVRHDPVDEGAEVADQALVYAALWNLGRSGPGTPARRAGGVQARTAAMADMSMRVIRNVRAAGRETDRILVLPVF